MNRIILLAATLAGAAALAGMEAHASDARAWQAERSDYLEGRSDVATIARAFDDPTSARLFYAWKTIERCQALHSLGVLDGGFDAGRAGGAATGSVGCPSILARHGSLADVLANLRESNRRLADRTTIDAVLPAPDGPIRTLEERFATVSATQDPLVMEEVGHAWARSSRSRFDGRPLADEASLWDEAWALAACEATRSCESSIGSWRLCRHRQRCDGSVRERLASVMAPAEFERLVVLAGLAQRAMRSRDLSSFR